MDMGHPTQIHFVIYELRTGLFILWLFIPSFKYLCSVFFLFFFYDFF